MYNNIGLHTPIMHPIDRKDKGYIVSIQRDVTDLDGIDAILAEDDKEYLLIEHTFFGNDKWLIFYDINLRRAFLKFMTHNCLEQLENKFLIGELQTETDSALRNIILCRSKGEDKYESIISIDLEEMALQWMTIMNFIHMKMQ